MLSLEWLWSWQRPEIEFATSLPVDECQVRLADALSYKRGIFGIETDHPVIGHVGGQRFYMAKAPSRLYRDAFLPFLYGRLSGISHGTTVQASYRLHTVMALFIMALGLFSCLLVLEGILAGNPVHVLFMMAAWGIWGAFIWVGSWRNRANREVLGSYLRAVLPASDGIA